VAVGERGRHVFFSSGAARAFSVISEVEAQGVIDLIKEMSSSVNVRILSEEESLVALLRSGASVDDLGTMKAIQNFLRIIGETSRVHKLVAEDSSEKKIEKYSEITLNYYRLISELGKSEPEDFSEFMNLFPLKHNLSSNYVSHLPPFLKPYYGLFAKREQLNKKRSKFLKKKFSDYYAEIRWIVRDVLVRKGVRGIVVPDDYLAVAVAKELELYGINSSIASPVSEIMLNDAPYNFVISALKCLDENFSFESVISLIENPFSNIERKKIYDIKDQCYEKNITKGIRDWKTLFDELKINAEIIADLESLYDEIDGKNGVAKLIEFSKKYLGERNYPKKILDILVSSFDEYSNDPTGIINDMESMKYLPKVSIAGSAEVLIGKPLDLIGVPLDFLYLAGMDAASSLRSFSEEARDFLAKIGIEGSFDNLTELAYSSLIDLSGNVILTYSGMDDKLSYTESTAFYDGISGDEEYVQRDSVFIPTNPLTDWELAKENKTSKKYILDEEIIKKRLEKPIYPTFIENYAGCHFKGFVNGMLNIDEIDSPREFLDPRTTGSMNHKILEKYYSTSLLPANFEKMADSYVRAEINKEKYESRTEALKFYRDKYLLNGKLVRFFVMDVNHALELGRKTVQKEFHFPTNDQRVLYEFGEKKIEIGGYVDRVDEENGGLCIIDYKSSLYGYPKNDLCDDRHSKIQLYFYKIGVETVMKKKVKAAAYVSFRDISEGFNTAGFYNAIPNEEAQVRKCKDIVDPVLEDFVSGDFDPLVKEGGSLWKCENELFCPLLSVCRVQERRW
jgi:hypothetical protein